MVSLWLTPHHSDELHHSRTISLKVCNTDLEQLGMVLLKWWCTDGCVCWDFPSVVACSADILWRYNRSYICLRISKGDISGDILSLLGLERSMVMIPIRRNMLNTSWSLLLPMPISYGNHSQAGKSSYLLGMMAETSHGNLTSFKKANPSLER
jgi:hypothetical protein